MIIPASHDGLTIVKIGNSWVRPTTQDMESIRDWVISHKDTWFLERKKLKKIFGYTIKVKPFPKIVSNTEYVWLIKQPDNNSYFYDEKDVENWKKVFNEVYGDPNFILFVWGGLTVQRINKVLVPFL